MHDAAWQQLKWMQSRQTRGRGREGARRGREITFSLLHCIIVVLVIKKYISSPQPAQHKIT